MMKRSPSFFHQTDSDNLPGVMGIRCIELGDTHSIMEMKVQQQHMNLMDSIHGGSVVSLADTAAGYGTYSNLPQGAQGFTTIELKCNFIRAITEGTLRCRADCIHQGKTTQVWDATVVDAHSGRKIAEFRCTQMILYPRENTNK